MRAFSKFFDHFSVEGWMSSGLRLETNPLSTTTSSSTQRAPALRMSTRVAGQEVIFLPRTRSALITQAENGSTKGKTKQIAA